MKKVGRINISKSLLHDESFKDYLYALFACFIPIHIENNEMSKSLVYWGYSELFTAIPEGVPVPFYEVQTMTVPSNDYITVKFIEVKNENTLNSF